MSLSIPRDRDYPKNAAGSSALLRQYNSRAVLDAIARSGSAMRVVEIMNLTGLSRPTVETVTDGLLGQGWVTVTEPDDAAAARGRGRPARLYSFNTRAAHVIGVDIGAHTVAVSIADLRGTVIATSRERVYPGMQALERLAVTTQSIETLLSRARIDANEILAATVGTPGTVSPAKDRIGKSPGMPGWPDIDVVEILNHTLQCDIELENDANLAAVGERALGVAQNYDDVLFLLLGERLGAGVISNGALVRGRDGAAGELGYVQASGSANRDPQYGPLESLVNASALIELGRATLRANPESALQAACDGHPERLTAEAITLAASEGDAAASTALESLASTLAQGIAPAVLTLNPEIIVIGGGISRAGNVVREALEKQLEALVLYTPDIRLSAMGDEAVVFGAIDQSIRRVEEEVLSKVSA